MYDSGVNSAHPSAGAIGPVGCGLNLESEDTEENRPGHLECVRARPGAINQPVLFIVGDRALPRDCKRHARLSPMGKRFTAGLVALMAISGACGGRYTTTGTDSTTAGSSSVGGTASFGASANTGATTSIGGASSFGGQPTFGGTTSYAGSGPIFAGSAPIGGACACDAIACPPGLVPVSNPDGCCFHCESVCSQTACPGVQCQIGYRPQMLPGQCCPSCVPDDVCDRERSQYQDFKKQLVDKYSLLSCMTANDCTVYYEKNQCQIGCGIVMPTAGIAFLDNNLQSYAQQNCISDCPMLLPPCEPSPPPRCLNGRCQ